LINYISIIITRNEDESPLGILTTPETTEVIYGAENIVNRTLEAYPSYNKTLDGCFDHIGPSAIVTTEPIFKALNGLVKRGLRLRYITEITPDNISYCKEMIKNGHQVRHLDGVKGNFGIADRTEYFAHGVNVKENRLPRLPSPKSGHL
jgi:hypothetical protein